MAAEAAAPKEELDWRTEESVYSKEMKFVEPHQITKPGEGDEVVVYNIMSPLMLEVAGDALGNQGMFHSGVSFVNSTNGSQVSVQFCAQNFGNLLMVPEVDRENDKLNFVYGATLAAHEGKMDWNYWRHAEKMAVITGAQYAQFIEWLEKETPKFSKYTLCHLRAAGDHVKQPCVQDFAGVHGETCSMTCFDSQQSILQAVQAITGPGAFSKDPATIFRNDIYLWMKPGTEARKMDMTPGSIDQQKVFFWYEMMAKETAACQGLEILGKMGEVIGTCGMDYAIYCDALGSYWSFTPAAENVTSTTFDPESLKAILPLSTTR